MATPQSAPDTTSTTPPPNPNSNSGAPPQPSNSTISGSPPPSPPPNSPPPSPPLLSPPPAPPKSPPPSSPPPKSPPPSSPSPPPPGETTNSPPPKNDSSSSSPPPPPSSSSPPPGDGSSSSPPPGSSSPPAPAAKSGSPPPGSPPPPSSPGTVSPPPGGNDGKPSPVFSPPPPGAISSSTPPPPSEKEAPRTPSSSRSSQPPPSRSSSRNSPADNSGSPPSNSSSSPSPDNTIIIAGVILGVFFIVAVVAVCIFCKTRKKKQRYYLDPARPPKAGDPYYNGATPAQWNTTQTMDHVVKLPPPPGVMGTPSPLTGSGGVGGAGGWAPSSAIQGVNSSTEFSSGYSGQHYNPHMTPPSPNMASLGFSKSQFSFEELAEATNGFSQANLLGQGGFGFVHKGVLPDGKEVAVKSLKSGSGQGEREFQAEVEIISRVHHRHLVSLVGYCIADGQRMLVYEFVSNKTLEFHLHGKGQPVMNWATRLQIALGSAKGLAYLHEDCHPRIIHRDIKAANILLDFNYEAMVADFGLAKLTSDNYTHVSTRVMGTFGYLAPEYASSGKLTEKSDVFSFGVMLLELITGRKPVDPSGTFMEDSLVDWARPLLTRALEDNEFNELVDPRLEGNFETHEMTRMIACASVSIRHSARRRPKMGQIVRALEGDSSLEDLNGGQRTVKPGSGGGSAAMTSSSETQTYDTVKYNADMMKFRKMVLSADQEFNSSEYGGDTSEYGLHPSSSSSDEFGRRSSAQQQQYYNQDKKP